MLTAIVERNTIRMVALVDQSLYQWFKTNLPVFETIPVRSTGTGEIRTDLGRISYVFAMGIDDNGKNTMTFLIQSWPNEISLDEAYELLTKHVIPR